jgi:membrane-bound lytic murein transglycosylase D
MKRKLSIVGLAAVLLLSAPVCLAHEIIFCGERIPVHNNFVAEKLMNIIRRQIPTVNLRDLRKRVEENFPVVEYYLKGTRLPMDFKYLAIVESGFLSNAVSSAGARGFWQLMPETAKEWGLVVTPNYDERDDIYKSTHAACKVIASYYKQIKQKYGVASWVLTAAAYNIGIGKMSNAISRQGADYFSMTLNDETAAYVYKIIAVKELFEYPELYMNDFGYNIFNNIAQGNTQQNNTKTDVAAFSSMQVKVDAKEAIYPDEIVVKEQPKMKKGEMVVDEADRRQHYYLPAVIQGKYKNFEDGSLVTIKLLEDMYVKGTFNRKGNLLQGKGWIIGNRVFIDLGYGTHDVSLVDGRGQKGVALNDLKNKEGVLLKLKNNNR